VVELARDHQVGRFVLISTDKAVDPVNVMGMTKRVAEMVVRQVAAETGRPYVAVRFGNVLGSRGSVIPLFHKQIATGGPVTLTHPDMVRYFMTIPEAVQLVLEASRLGTNGEVFVLDMGDPVKITDLAHDMIRLSGLQVGHDIQVVYTGLRPGERLFEPLFNPGETHERTTHHKIFVTRNTLVPSPDEFRGQLDDLLNLAREGRTAQAREKLAEISALGIERTSGESVEPGKAAIEI